MEKDKTKDGETATSETNSPWDACQDSCQDTQDLSQDCEAQDATLAQTITEAVVREMAKAHVHYQAILNERSTATLQTSLKVSSGANGFMVMDPFNWTKDKSIYQRWQLWSEKARLALDAMKGDSEKTKISYFHHWINGEGMGHIESWKNTKTLISQSACDELESTEGKYSSECIESYFTLFELSLAPKSNPLLAVEELHFTKQGSMTSGEFHSHIVKIAKRCKFPNPKAEERAIRDANFLGMNSQWARDKAINLMNEEAKELTVEFLMNQLAIEDCNAQHKILSQLNSSSSVNFAAYDHRQNKGKSNKSKCTSGKTQGQNNSRAQGSSNHSQPSRKPPGMEGKCMRCGKPEHQQGQKCAAKNAKCNECHKTGHFHKVCQSKKRGRRANLIQAQPQSEQDTHINENGVRQPNPPMVNMLKIVNHIGATKGSQEKHPKFPIDVDPRGPYKHHLVVRVDTGADINCMNEKTFRRLFPKVKLSVCPHKIQNFGNSVADISILGQFHIYLQFRGEKYLNTFIVTNSNDCPNLLSHEATFRMCVLLPNYPEENVVRGKNVPNFKINTSKGTSSNVFQILQDLQLKQYQEKCHSDSMQIESKMFHTGPHCTTNTLIQNTAQPVTSFRTTTPSTAMTERTTTKQVNPVQVHPETSCKAPQEHCTNPQFRSVNQVNR